MERGRQDASGSRSSSAPHLLKLGHALRHPLQGAVDFRCGSSARSNKRCGPWEDRNASELDPSRLEEKAPSLPRTLKLPTRRHHLSQSKDHGKRETRPETAKMFEVVWRASNDDA
jgi:hypothetical protein